MSLKKIALSLLVAGSSLFAIDAVTNLSVSAPHNSGTVTNDSSIDFTWTPPTGVAQYYYKLDTNSTNYNLASEGGYTTLNSSSATGLTVTAPASGDYYLHLVAVDSGSVTSSPALAQVTSSIDIDAGTVTMNPTAGSITTDDNAITLTGSETGTIYYTVDGTTPDINSSVYSTALTIGVSATIQAILVDTAGNTQATASEAAYTITNNPGLTKANDDAAVDGTTISTDTTNSLKVTGTDLTRYKYKKSTDSTWTTVSSISTSIDISSLTSGTYTYELVGGDAYNFQADSAKTSFTFTVDNTAPSGLAVLVNSVEADETNSTTVTFADNFTFTLSSADTNDTIYYTTNGSTPTNTSTVYTSGVTTTESVSLGTTGTVVVKMIAYDTIGNASAVKSVTLTIDKEAPTLVLPTGSVYSSPTAVTASSDDTAATMYYQVTTSSSQPTALTASNIGNWELTATIGSPTLSTYKYLHVTAMDEVGNVSTIGTVTYTYSQSGTSILSADALLFNDTETDASSTAVLTITNSGDNSITLADANITVSGADFNKTSTTCTTLSSGATCNVTLTFNPTTKGLKSGLVSVAYDGTNESELNATLAGYSLGTAPTVATAEINATEDIAAAGFITASDVDTVDTAFTYTLDTNASNGTVVVNSNGAYAYQADTNYNGTDSFSVIISDGDLNSTAQTVSVTVSAVNDTPAITTLSSVSKAEDAADFIVSLGSTDVDGDSVTYSAASGDTSIATVSVTDNNLTVSLVADANGVVTIDVNVTDGTATDTTSFDINVTNSDDAPVLVAIADQNATEDFANFNVALSATDIDGDTITYTVSSSDESVATVTIVGGNVVVSKVANANGTATIEVNATANSAVSTQTFDLTVAPVNDAPTWDATIATQTTAEDTNLPITLSATDVDGDTLTYTATASNTSLVTLTVSGDTLTIAPKSNMYGDLNITVNVIDEANVTVAQTFDLNITAVDDAPTITAVAAQRAQIGDANITVDVNATDIESDTITYDANSSDTTVATVDINTTTGVITIDPQDANGTATVTVTAITTAASTTSTFTVTVKDTAVVFDLNGTGTYDADANETTTTFVVDNGGALDVVESDTGEVSATLDGTYDVNLVISVVGADIAVDENGTLTTTLVDGSVTKEIEVATDGVVTAELNTTTTDNSVTSSYTGTGDTNTTVTSTGVETTVTTATSTVSVVLAATGTATSTVTVGTDSTEVVTSIVDAATTIDADGDVQTSFTMQDSSAANVSIVLDVSATDGTLTPAISNNVVPTSLPAGTTATVTDGSTVTFEFVLPAGQTVTFN